MSCGAFGGVGSCGGGGGGGGGGALAGGAGAGFGGPRHYADKRFFDPFCIPVDNKRCEPTCYFNPFVHAQCLGVDMNMQGFRNDILKCQDDYKKAVWAVLKKYAVGEGKEKEKGNNNNTSNNSYGVPAFMNDMNLNMNNLNASLGMPMRNSRMLQGHTGNAARRSISSGFQYDAPRMYQPVAPRNYMHGAGGFGGGRGGSNSSFGGSSTGGFGTNLGGDFGLGSLSNDDLGLGSLINGDFSLGGGGGGGFGRGFGGGQMA